ncbi:hypothetical protein BLL42_06880 [Pseudomonas frederiksbergensis]|uniref:Uncharacterized protein n=2 Tax=Pseudomonas frederiksbergensis TaxID=104087 RepID=A0A1J0EHK1_9PSED|nr:hypothetical protein BLL42_06880 [Pseudomonas frederiksbergensis]
MWLPTAYAAAEPRPLEGHYYLRGAMEMGAELLLRKDGTFAGGVAYGSAGGIAKGTWHVEDDILTLETEADSQPAKKLAFNFSRERTLAELEEYSQYSNNDNVDLVRKNYVMEMRYARLHPKPPAIKPVYVSFEFSQGPSSQLLLNSNEQTDLWLPYDPQRTLKKIGFATSRSSSPSQWFDVSPASRSFSIGWKKPKNQPISFEKPEESGLAETQRFLAADAQDRISKNYMVTLFHYDPITPPAVNPVDVYWQFQDGSTQQQIWADSNQLKLTQPYSATQTLQKVGLRMKGSTKDIQWFDITPDTRWLGFEWEAYPDPANGDLSVLFQDLRLAIEPDCLAVDFGNGKACFRRN